MEFLYNKPSKVEKSIDQAFSISMAYARVREACEAAHIPLNPSLHFNHSKLASAVQSHYGYEIRVNELHNAWDWNSDDYMSHIGSLAPVVISHEIGHFIIGRYRGEVVELDCDRFSGAVAQRIVGLCYDAVTDFLWQLEGDLHLKDGVHPPGPLRYEAFNEGWSASENNLPVRFKTRPIALWL